MAKYDEAFKLGVVEQYLSGSVGFRRLSQELGLDPGTLRRWVAHYRQHGVAGLSARHRPCSAAFKMQVLNRMWREALSYRQVAALFDLRSSYVVGVWERQYHAGGEDALIARPRGRPPKMPTPPPPPATATPDDALTREELLDELKQLRAEVAYLKKVEALIQAPPSAAPKKRK